MLVPIGVLFCETTKFWIASQQEASFALQWRRMEVSQGIRVRNLKRETTTEQAKEDSGKGGEWKKRRCVMYIYQLLTITGITVYCKHVLIKKWDSAILTFQRKIHHFPGCQFYLSSNWPWRYSRIRWQSTLNRFR